MHRRNALPSHASQKADRRAEALAIRLLIAKVSTKTTPRTAVRIHFAELPFSFSERDNEIGAARDKRFAKGRIFAESNLLAGVPGRCVAFPLRTACSAATARPAGATTLQTGSLVDTSRLLTVIRGIGGLARPP